RGLVARRDVARGAALQARADDGESERADRRESLLGAIERGEEAAQRSTRLVAARAAKEKIVVEQRAPDGRARRDDALQTGVAHQRLERPARERALAAPAVEGESPHRAADGAPERRVERARRGQEQRDGALRPRRAHHLAQRELRLVEVLEHAVAPD